jgi:hypothetical protein
MSRLPPNVVISVLPGDALVVAEAQFSQNPGILEKVTQ